MTQATHNQDTANGLILVVDDDLITRLFLQEMLRKAGFETHLVGNGKEAIPALESRCYDLIIMDCNMPLMDGFETTRHIRDSNSDCIDPRIPIIALTGLNSRTDQRRCLNTGMNICVSKPVDSRTLSIAIGKLLGNKKAGNQRFQQGQRQAERVSEDTFLSTLIVNFLAEVPQVIAGLKIAVKNEDLRELKDMAHRLKGVSGVLKISKLSTLSTAMEHAGKAGEFTLAAGFAKEIIDELRRLATMLQP